MSRRARRIAIIIGGLIALMLVLGLSTVLVLRSEWFREKVRDRIVAEVEKATGGRSEIGAFHFDWKSMRAQLDRFTLHGTEPAGEVPLFRADSIAVGVKIVSIFKRDVDIQYLEVKRPQVYLIIHEDGSTNIPSPKVKRAGKGTVATILDLAIGRFDLQNGSCAVQGRGRTPFEGHGSNLRAQFTYDTVGPRYRGRISVAPADLQWAEYRPLSLDLDLALSLERNRVQVEMGRVATAQSQAEFSGTIENFTDPAGSFEYKTRLALAEVVRTLRWRTQLQGPVTLAGHFRFHGAGDYLATGSMHIAGLLFHPDPNFLMQDFRADAAVSIDPRRIEVSRMRLSGLAMASLSGGRSLQRIPLEGRIATVVLRESILDATGIHLDQLGGSFEGKAQITDFEWLRVEGDVAGFDVQQMLRVYNGQSVPWDAAASGPVQLSVSLKRVTTLKLAAHMAITPALTGSPVTGSIDAKYDAANGTLDLGRSFLALPATRVEFSGVLGQQLRVHATSRDLNDVLPAFNVHSLPVQLRNGEASFEGAITGKLDDPDIAGRGSATNLDWSGRTFDRVNGDIDLTRAGLTVRNGNIQRGKLHGQAVGSLGMRDWKVEDSSPVAASASIRAAPAPDLLAIAGVQSAPIDGTVNADGKISGTFGSPRIDSTFTVMNGAIDGEPFDRFTGAMRYTGQIVEMDNAELTGGGRKVRLQANYQHQPGRFESGRLRFQVDTNAMPLNQFQLARKQFPGIDGTVESHATGLADIAPAKSGEPGFQLISLNGTFHAAALRINDQPLRDVTLTAATRGAEIVANLNSELAGSVIHGEGRWRLEKDYPGKLQISFNRIDLARLAAWLGRSKAPGGVELAGSAEGTLSITGPAIKPELWKASLRLPSLQVGPGGDLAAKGSALALHNQAPIVITMEHDVIKVDSARLVGRSTDFSLSGAVNLQQKNPLDLRLSGRFDLATLQDFNPDIYSGGAMETGVTIRGALAQPQINGRLEIKDATFSLSDIPLGVYKANGVILFDGRRATIQSLSGESGGGKLTLSGFAGYTGEALVFRLHADAQAVRVRYPEDFSTVANASLNLTGASDSSMLSGQVTILRTGFNPHSDFSSVLAKSAGPVRTTAAQTGLLANMHFDVEIETAPDITFQSSLAQGIQAEASLRLRGTGSNPSLLGRINITQGQIVFFGTQFSVNQGSIAFYNPVKIEPVLNLDLETKARGIDVILNISGPINKLNLTPRSDPPLPFSEILALLATGRSPTSDYATLMSSPAAPQSLQQLGASALLGQAIASPVTGRLQRFFGVTRLKIDPTLTGLTGVANNPQARLTIEQQVTPDITFTYITDVTSSNPLVVRVEWAVSRHWSAVALREENGLFGLEFLYKTRFK